MATGWYGARPMPTPRAEVASALVDGRIYVVGGFTEDGKSSNVVEVYDPKSDTWTDIEPMPERLDHPMAAGAGGKLFVIGGWRVFGEQASDAVHEYDPATGRWRSRANLPLPRAAGGAASDGATLYVIGGIGPEPETGFAYDVATDTWQRLAPMTAPREHLAVVVANRKVYAIGGRWSDRGNVATVEEYDPPTDTWRARSPMPTARGGLAAAVVRLPFSGERIHVVGGESFGEGSRTFDNNEAYDPVDDTWSTKAPMPLGRHGLAAQAIDDEVYVIAGGQTPGLSVSDYVYRLVQHDLPPVTIDEQAPPIEAGE